jgi:putative transposase
LDSVQKAQWQVEEVPYIAQPETVVKWHRQGFKLFWRYISRPKNRLGQPPIDKELIKLIRRLDRENPTWGAPRIHGELLSLGFQVSERTVSNYLPKTKEPTPKDVIRRWKNFINNHGDDIVATDFFTIPTRFFRQLYVLFFIHHGSRRIIGWGVTFNPTANWIIQQLRNAFPGEHPYKYLITDRDKKFCPEVIDAIKEMGLKHSPTAPRSPWQNPYAERFVGSCRRDLFDHIIAKGAIHASRLFKSYVDYYHEDRTHLGLEKSPPAGRARYSTPPKNAKIFSIPKVGGLHHRYEWQLAA